MRGAIEQYVKASVWTRAVMLYREMKKQKEVIKDYHRYARVGGIRRREGEEGEEGEERANVLQ